MAHVWNEDDLRVLLLDEPGFAASFLEDWFALHVWLEQVGSARLRDPDAVLRLGGQPNRLRFEAGDLLTQAVIAELIARKYGPHVLLPDDLSEAPILVRAGDDPARLVAEWEKRTAELGS
jgi:hypothetical protein